MSLPEDFDKNEWFIIIGIVLSIIGVILLPRKFPLSIAIIIMVFSSANARIFDYFLGSPRPDLYDVMDSPRFELFDVMTYLYYAPFAYFFLFAYEKLKVKGLSVLLFLLICSLIGTLYEGLHVLIGVFTYKSWNLLYSFPVYLTVQASCLLLYQYLLKCHRERVGEYSDQSRGK